MADIDTYTALLIAAISAGSAILGATIGSATNYLIERQRNKNEEEIRQQEEEAKKLNLRYQAYIQFLGIKYEDATLKYIPDTDRINPDATNAIAASIMAYGSPNVSSLLARSFPLISWITVNEIRKAIISELVQERGGKLSFLASAEAIELDAQMGIDDGPRKTAKIKSWWQFWRR